MAIQSQESNAFKNHTIYRGNNQPKRTRIVQEPTDKTISPTISPFHTPDTNHNNNDSFINRFIIAPIRDGFNRFIETGKDLVKKFKDWFVSQRRSWSNPNEDVPNNGNCGFTSLAMVYKMFGGKCDPKNMNGFIENLRTLCKASPNEYTGSTMDQLARGANKLGLNATSTTKSIDQMAKGLDNGKKYILAIDPGKLYPNLGPGSHAIVCFGIDRAKGVALIADPGDTKGPREVPLSALKNAMSKFGNAVTEISGQRNLNVAA